MVLIYRVCFTLFCEFCWERADLFVLLSVMFFVCLSLAHMVSWVMCWLDCIDSWYLPSLTFNRLCILNLRLLFVQLNTFSTPVSMDYFHCLFSHQRVSQTLCFSRGMSVPEYLRKHIVTCELPWGSGPLSPLPIWIRIMYLYVSYTRCHWLCVFCECGIYWS